MLLLPNRPVIFSLLFFLGIVLISCSEKKDEPFFVKQPFVLPDSLAKRLVLDSLQLTPYQNLINLTGKVSYNQDHVIRIYPLVSGMTQEVKVGLGDHVMQGQSLALVKSSEMAGFSNDLVTAQTNLAIARKNWDATSDMYQAGLASSRDFVGAKAALQQAQATLLKARRVLKINGNNQQGLYQIKAPITGFVVEKQIANNMAIRPDNGNGVFTISDLKDVWVFANAFESVLPQIHLGDSAAITTIAYPNRVFYGKINKILNVLDSSNKVARIRIAVSNPDLALKPEMFAYVTVMGKTDSKVTRLSIPSSALIADNSQYFVLIYKSKSNIVIRPVQIDGQVGNRTFILKGLEKGEKIISSDTFSIYQQLNS